jgi:hypothetical protein
VVRVALDFLLNFRECENPQVVELLNNRVLTERILQVLLRRESSLSKRVCVALEAAPIRQHLDSVLTAWPTSELGTVVRLLLENGCVRSDADISPRVIGSLIAINSLEALEKLPRDIVARAFVAAPDALNDDMLYRGLLDALATNTLAVEPVVEALLINTSRLSVLLKVLSTLSSASAPALTADQILAAVSKHGLQKETVLLMKKYYQPTSNAELQSVLKALVPRAINPEAVLALAEQFAAAVPNDLVAVLLDKLLSCFIASTSVSALSKSIVARIYAISESHNELFSDSIFALDNADPHALSMFEKASSEFGHANAVLPALLISQRQVYLRRIVAEPSRMVRFVQHMFSLTDKADEKRTVYFAKVLTELVQIDPLSFVSRFFGVPLCVEAFSFFLSCAPDSSIIRFMTLVLMHANTMRPHIACLPRLDELRMVQYVKACYSVPELHRDLQALLEATLRYAPSVLDEPSVLPTLVDLVDVSMTAKGVKNASADGYAATVNSVLPVMHAQGHLAQFLSILLPRYTFHLAQPCVLQSVLRIMSFVHNAPSNRASPGNVRAVEVSPYCELVQSLHPLAFLSFASSVNSSGSPAHGNGGAGWVQKGEQEECLFIVYSLLANILECTFSLPSSTVPSPRADAHSTLFAPYSQWWQEVLAFDPLSATLSLVFSLSFKAASLMKPSSADAALLSYFPPDHASIVLVFYSFLTWPSPSFPAFSASNRFAQHVFAHVSFAELLPVFELYLRSNIADTNTSLSIDDLAVECLRAKRTNATVAAFAVRFFRAFHPNLNIDSTITLPLLHSDVPLNAVRDTMAALPLSSFFDEPSLIRGLLDANVQIDALAINPADAISTCACLIFSRADRYVHALPQLFDMLRTKDRRVVEVACLYRALLLRFSPQHIVAVWPHLVHDVLSMLTPESRGNTVFHILGVLETSMAVSSDEWLSVAPSLLEAVGRLAKPASELPALDATPRAALRPMINVRFSVEDNCRALLDLWDVVTKHSFMTVNKSAFEDALIAAMGRADEDDAVWVEADDLPPPSPVASSPMSASNDSDSDAK